MATNDVLKALLENELLTDDVKKSVETAFAAIVEEQKKLAEEAAVLESAKALNEARAEMEAQVRTELATKFVAERAQLIKSLDEKVTEMLTSEISELKEDINDFRDLEVEMIAKLEDEKELLAKKFATEKKVFITKIDEFVEARLSAELQELHEDINIIKQNTFGKKMFESFVTMYEDSFADADEHVKSVTDKLNAMANEKAAAEARTLELEEQVSEMKRSKALEETLAPLSGKRKAVMESILAGFAPEKFSAVYKKMITRVMDTVPVNDKEETPVSENVAVTEEKLSETIEIVNGDNRLEESENVNEVVVKEDSKLNTIRKLAGITTK